MSKKAPHESGEIVFSEVTATDYIDVRIFMGELMTMKSDTNFASYVMKDKFCTLLEQWLEENKNRSTDRIVKEGEVF